MVNKILITGSNGMLGKDMSNIFISKGHTVYGINRNIINESNVIQYNCDLLDFNKTKKILKHINPDIIINCAANINLDTCEIDKKNAYRINSEVSEFLASYKPQETKYVYISTDSVFDGKVGNYKEEDKANPLNYYAYTKLMGEKLSLEINPSTIIIRTNIYGFNIPTKKSLVEWAIDNLKRENPILGFDDVYFNPVYTNQLAKACYDLVNNKFKGLINVGSKNKLSKYDFLIKLARQFNFNENFIIRGSVDDMNFNVKRPKLTNLDIKRVQSLVDIDLSIDSGIRRLYEDYIL